MDITLKKIVGYKMYFYDTPQNTLKVEVGREKLWPIRYSEGPKKKKKILWRWEVQRHGRDRLCCGSLPWPRPPRSSVLGPAS